MKHFVFLLLCLCFSFFLAPSFISYAEKLSQDVIILENDLLNEKTVGYQEEKNTLYFGSQLEKFLSFDPNKNAFVFSSDVDFGGNQLVNARLENLPIAPLCASSSKGRAYHNTTDDYSYVCDGTVWKILDTDNSTNPPISPFITSLDPERIAINTTHSIKVSGYNFTDDTIFTASDGAVITSFRIIDGETAELEVSAGPTDASVVIQAKNGTREWIGNKVILKVGSGNSIDDILINFTNADIAQYVPKVFPINFDMGLDGATYINDGGTGLPNEMDMYDRGNYLSTNLFKYIPYTGGRLVSSHSAWGGKSYLTNVKNNIFFLVGEIGDGVDTFSVTGNLGADGGGSVDTVKISYGGYDAYIKRVYGAGSDPSVNHMFIVKSGSTLSHSVSINTDLDDDSISGLQSVRDTSDPKLYYIMFATRMGGYVDDDTMRTIMAYMIDTIIN